MEWLADKDGWFKHSNRKWVWERPAAVDAGREPLAKHHYRVDLACSWCGAMGTAVNKYADERTLTSAYFRFLERHTQHRAQKRLQYLSSEFRSVGWD